MPIIWLIHGLWQNWAQYLLLQWDLLFRWSCFCTFIAGSIGTGVTSLTSHALGQSDHDSSTRIVTHGFILTAIISVILAIAGYFTISPLFKLLGANDQTLPLVRNYMKVWYFGAITMAFPMMGNGILISLGDSKSASRFMVLGAALNCILDPIMISDCSMA